MYYEEHKGERKMKKKVSVIVLILLVSILVNPFKVQAADIDIANCTSEDLVTTFKIEGITNYDVTKYNKKNDKRINVYVFRGDGCRNCKNFYEYYVANKLLASHGDKIKIISYEVKNNPQNFRLLNAAKTLLNEQSNAYATPTVFIGNKTFSGDLVVNNATQKQAEMETAINALYNSSNRYDIIEELTCKNVFSDNTTNITLTSAKKLDKNYVLKVKKVDYQNLKLENAYHYMVGYDISMYKGNVVVPLSNGSYKITIPISDKYLAYKVGYVKDGKIQEELKATYQNGCIEFTTTHLSEYVVYGTNTTKPETNPDSKPDSKPNTNPDTKPETKPDSKPNINPDTKPETKPDNNQEVKPETKPVENENINETINSNVNQKEEANTVKNQETEKEQNPKTLDGIQIYIILLGLGVSSLIGSLILFRKKRI